LRVASKIIRVARNPQLATFLLIFRFDGDGEAFGLELILIEFGPFLVGDDKKRDAAVVGFEHLVQRFLAIERSEFNDGVDDKNHLVLVVVVKKDSPGRQLCRGWRCRRGFLPGRGDSGANGTAHGRCFNLFPRVGHDELILNYQHIEGLRLDIRLYCAKVSGESTFFGFHGRKCVVRMFKLGDLEELNVYAALAGLKGSTAR
jgi:hypothetical protein